jgi:iron-sulfur cluster repair protein YtfE (RIC family)
MKEIVILIDEILAEHGLINEDFSTLARAAAKLGAGMNGEGASDSSRRPGPAFVQLGIQLGVIHNTLLAHFNREEVALENAVRMRDDSEVFLVLHQFWQEHQAIINDLSELRALVAHLASSHASNYTMEGDTQELKTRVRSFSTELAEHASREGLQLSKLKTYLLAN